MSEVNLNIGDILEATSDEEIIKELPEWFKVGATYKNQDDRYKILDIQELEDDYIITVKNLFTDETSRYPMTRKIKKGYARVGDWSGNDYAGNQSEFD